MAAAVKGAVPLIREGQSLTTALESTRMLENLALEMVKVGEQTGALADMLTAVADFYDEELDTRLATVLALVEPVMLVVMAVVVAGMLLSPSTCRCSRRSRRSRGAMSETVDAPGRDARPAAPPPTRGEEAGSARALAARYQLEYVDVALVRARPRDPAVGAGRADVPLQLPALPARWRAGWCW